MQIPTPPAEDDQVRRQRDAERSAQEQAAARTAEATTIGAGGLVVKDGGSIRVESPGTIDLPGGSFSANTIGATTLTATTSVTAGGTVQGATLVSTGGASVAGTASVGALTAGGEVSGNHATFAGGVNSVDVYNRLLTYGGGYKNQYIHTDGNMGYVPSSRRFKRDIEEWTFDPAIISYLRVVTFRYIAAVENLGDEAEQELGLIAEEVFELGYYWLVDYEIRYTEDGANAPVPFQGEVEAVPFGVKYERICLILLSWAQSIELRLEAAGI